MSEILGHTSLYQKNVHLTQSNQEFIDATRAKSFEVKEKYTSPNSENGMAINKDHEKNNHNRKKVSSKGNDFKTDVNLAMDSF